MTRRDILAVVQNRRRGNAVDSATVSALTGCELRKASAWLCILKRQGFVERIPTYTRRDRWGRRRLAYAYYAATTPRAPRAQPKPFNHEPLATCWQ